MVMWFHLKTFRLKNLYIWSLSSQVRSSTSLFHSMENMGVMHELQKNNIEMYERFTVWWPGQPEAMLAQSVSGIVVKFSDTLSKLPLLKREHTILLNSSVMWVCGLAIGQPCLVNSHHVLTLWPCNSLPATSILLPPLLADIITESTAGEASTVTVERFTPSGSVEAERIEIELE